MEARGGYLDSGSDWVNIFEIDIQPSTAIALLDGTGALRIIICCNRKFIFTPISVVVITEYDGVEFQSCRAYLAALPIKRIFSQRRTFIFPA